MGDIAKIILLFQNGAQRSGEQLLSATKLDEILYRRGLTGLPTGYRFAGGNPPYHLSFWSVAYDTRDGCYFQVPYMSGLGGNTVGLAPISYQAPFRLNQMPTKGVKNIGESFRARSGRQRHLTATNRK